jgi:hypothetical protein
VVLVDQFVFGFLGLALCDANYVFFFGQHPFGFGVSIFKKLKISLWNEGIKRKRIFDLNKLQQ